MPKTIDADTLKYQIEVEPGISRKAKDQIKRMIDLIPKGVQAPMKIRPSDYTHVKALDEETNKVLTYTCAKCPACDKWLVANPNHKYCQYCGQLLMWEEKE